ncbi:MAG: hypothetical protein KKI15_07675 [Proteobacteria bacterium]|nr:hypothetical protein [Pseudomonadota bacterium]
MEKPILFQREMVKAILAGRKTQTRRIAKVTDHGCKHGFVTPKAGFVPRKIQEHLMYCPYGKPGDSLWVRETFFDSEPYANPPLFASGPRFLYRADDSDIGCHKWKPSIHMPRTACRLVLLIASVRLERLHDISDDDSYAEGVEPGTECPKLGFKWFWDCAYEGRKGSEWDDNPWVWALEFESRQCA